MEEKRVGISLWNLISWQKIYIFIAVLTCVSVFCKRSPFVIHVNIFIWRSEWNLNFDILPLKRFLDDLDKLNIRILHVTEMERIIRILQPSANKCHSSTIQKFDLMKNSFSRVLERLCKISREYLLTWRLTASDLFRQRQTFNHMSWNFFGKALEFPSKAH